MNANELLTKADLENFRKQLLQDLAAMMRNLGQGNEKTWLRSSEVKELLGISSGTLMNLRIKGHLKPSKIEGVYFYRLSEIKALLNAGTTAE